MNRLLEWMHWKNSRGKWNWFEISTDILIIAIFGVITWITMIVK